MASDARPPTVRGVALAAVLAVVLVGLGVLVWTDGLGASAVQPLWDRSTDDVRVLLLFDGPLALVLAALPAVVAVAVVAWRRERAKPDRSVDPAPAAAPPRSASELVGAWRGSGSLGLLFAALAAAGACFTVYGTVDSIWGEPSLRLSAVSLGGAAVLVAALMGPGAGAAGPTDGDRRGLRRAAAVLAGAIALYGLVLPGVDRTSLSIDDARRRLGGDGPGGSSSPTVEDYYRRLYGPSLGADEFVITGNSELGVVVVLARDGGYDDLDLGRLDREARQFGLPRTSVLVHRGLAIILLGSGAGLSTGSGEDQRDRVRELLDDG